jgi:hypothetical protein
MRKDFLNRNPIVLEIRARIAKQDYTELKKKKKLLCIKGNKYHNEEKTQKRGENLYQLFI